MALQSMTALKSMSIEKLVKLQSGVEATLAQKVSEERRALQQELTKLGGYAGAKKARGGRLGPAAPKYRNPENSSETWAGRGLKPRWLTAAMKSGKKLEDFAIRRTSKGTAAKRAKKKRKPGK